MSAQFFVVFLPLLVLQLILPRRIAFAPLIFAATGLGNIDILPDLSACRCLILVGILRLLFQFPSSLLRYHKTDAPFIAFCSVSLIVSLWPRQDIPSPFSQNVGLILNVCGTYLYGKGFLAGPKSVSRLASTLGIAIIPLGIVLTAEKVSARNYYFELGAKSAGAVSREGKIRAAGPFRSPILAGTAGATSIPLLVLLYNKSRTLGLASLLCAIAVVFASSSSGPLAAVAISVGSLMLWPYRRNVRSFKWILGATLVFLHLISSRGVWYLMAHLDLVGGSTGYHRAKLIDNAFADISSWWLHGTDFTRHWMFSGVSWSDRHTDVTNYYLHLGVIGGLGLTLTLIWILSASFAAVGNSVEQHYRTLVAPEASRDSAILPIWCAGCALAAHSISFVSISYFDQIYVLFYLLVAAISSESAWLSTSRDSQSDHTFIIETEAKLRTL